MQVERKASFHGITSMARNHAQQQSTVNVSRKPVFLLHFNEGMQSADATNDTDNTALFT